MSTHTRAQDGSTALIEAVQHGYADCAQLLLDAGADKEAKNEVCDRSSASFWAFVSVGVSEMVIALFCFAYR